MYKVLSAKNVDFTDDSGRKIVGVSVYLLPDQGSSEYVFFGVEPVKVFFHSNIQLPQFRADAKYNLLYDMFGSKPRVIGIVEVK